MKIEQIEHEQNALLGSRKFVLHAAFERARQQKPGTRRGDRRHRW